MCYSIPSLLFLFNRALLIAITVVTPARRNHLTASLNLVGMEEQRTLFFGHAGELYYNEKLEQFEFLYFAILYC